MKKTFKAVLVFSLFVNVVLVFKTRNLIYNKIFPQKSDSEINQLEWVKKVTKDPYSADDNVPLVTYSIFDRVNFIKVDDSDNNYTKLPDSLMIPAGNYSFYGRNYKLEKEGLYRFIYPGVDNEQRIVYNGSIDSLLSSISWMVTHGNSDDGLTTNALMQKATDSKLFITCGTVSTLTNKILERVGIRSRVVLGMTTEKWNNYDNGHTLIEVYRERYKKWVLYDLDNNCFFKRDKEPLSLVELSYLIANNQEYQIEEISKDTRLAVNSFKDKNGYSYEFYSESIIATKNSLKKWYRRVLQVPMINKGDHYFFHDYDSISKKKILTYSANYKPVDSCTQFLEMFYSRNYNLDELRLTMCKKH